MSRPEFLADHDFNESIISGVLRREPTVAFAHVGDFGLQEEPDDGILDFAAGRGWIVVSHDVNTMPAAAFSRLSSGLPLPGLFVVSQSVPVIAVIESLILIWAASEAEEWSGQVLFLPL